MQRFIQSQTGRYFELCPVSVKVLVEQVVIVCTVYSSVFHVHNLKVFLVLEYHSKLVENMPRFLDSCITLVNQCILK